MPEKLIRDAVLKIERIVVVIAVDAEYIAAGAGVVAVADIDSMTVVALRIADCINHHSNSAKISDCC